LLKPKLSDLYFAKYPNSLHKIVSLFEIPDKGIILVPLSRTKEESKCELKPVDVVDNTAF